MRSLCAVTQLTEVNSFIFNNCYIFICCKMLVTKRRQIWSLFYMNTFLYPKCICICIMLLLFWMRMSLICYLKIDLYCIVSIAYNETFYKITEWDEKKKIKTAYSIQRIFIFINFAPKTSTFCFKCFFFIYYFLNFLFSFNVYIYLYLNKHTHTLFYYTHTYLVFIFNILQIIFGLIFI